MGINICSNVPENIQKAAYDASNRPFKRNIGSSHLEHNLVNSNSLSTSSKGNAEFYQMPTSTDFIGGQFESYIDKIWGWLINEEVQVIGVCGMGGVGKSTLLKHIHNKLLDASCHVIWVDVQRGSNVLRLQKAIVESCDVCLLETDGPMKIAAKLLHALKKIKKCIIIFDDVWDDIDLESLGIPLTNSDVQVIIASRLFDVCQTMGSKKHILKMVTLELIKDCPHLFFKVLGKDESLLSHEIINIAKSIIQKCDGLPLAIATIARSMRGKDDLKEWKYVLENLRNLEKEQHMKKSVFPSLALSYDHLNDKFLQECFVCCAFYLANNRCFSNQEELITHFIVEGLIDGNKSLEAQLVEGHVILNKLIKNNLLIEDSEYGYIHIHILVYAWATSIANESAGYMVKRQVSPEHEWKENLQKVMLTVKEIPSTSSPKCPMLSTLLLCYSYDLKLIPNSFFINMPSLKVLNLSYCDEIECLPTSISNLESLITLFLRGCASLKYVPSLAKLRKLERLDLCRTAITELPSGLEMLINLRWLNLAGIKDLTMSYPLVISKLINLQVLFLGENTIRGGVEIQDLVGLKKLEYISAYFTNRNEFNASVRRIVNAQNGGTQKCLLQLLGKPHEFDDIWWDSFNSKKTILFSDIGNTDYLLLPVDVNELKIEFCYEWRCLCDVLSFDDKNNSKFCKITECSISGCRELEHVFCLSSSCSFCSSFQSLEILFLQDLRSLSMLCKETNVAATTPWAPFSYLRNIFVYGCHHMKTLLTPVMTGHLQNLEDLTVSNCNAMEEIFSSEKNNESTDIDIDISMMMFPDYQLLEGLLSSGTGSNYQEEQVTDAVYIDHTHAARILLPKLKAVYLRSLPRLNRVYKGILACNSLQKFKIYDCPNLKPVPQIQPPFENFKIM